MARNPGSPVAQDHEVSAPRLGLPWRIVLYGVAYFALQVVCLLVGLLPSRVVQGDIGLGLGDILFSVVFIPATILLTRQFRRRVDQQSWRGMALGPLGAGVPALLMGFVVGAVMIGAVFLVEYAAGWLRVVGTEVGSAGLRAALGGLLVGLLGSVALAPGFTEELAFRGYIFQNLGQRLPLWAAMLLTGVLFGVFHVIPAFLNGFDLPFVLSFLVSATLLTTFLVLCRLGTGALWLGIGWHIAFNWGETSLLGLGTAKHPLLHTELTGPAVIVGAAPFVTEDGALVMLLTVVSIGFAALWLQRGGRRIDWRGRLDDDGQLAGLADTARAGQQPRVH